MIVSNYTNFRAMMKGCLDEVTEKDEVLVLTRKDSQNVVIMSMARYNKLLKLEEKEFEILQRESEGKNNV